MQQSDIPTPRVYIFGAGFAGRSLATEIRRKSIYGSIAAFLDDDPEKIGRHLDDIPVLGPITDVAGLLQTEGTDRAIIAMPSASRERLREIYRLLKRQKFSRIEILPDIEQIVDGSAHLIQTRDINPEDLLLRKPVNIGLKESISYLRDKRVLITGAGGSIGSELSRQLLHGGASRLYLFGHGENSIYQIERELRLLQQEGIGERATIVPIIGELQDSRYMNFILPRIRPDVIFHTAAYKHVPMTEHNPVMAISNNVFGTRNILRAMEAIEGCRLVLISSDKVVEPASVYGASKKLAEELVLSAGQGPNACMVVRFGNVLGSRGSIIPLFKNQILNGGPVTITHKDMKRLFMTIPEAASLVLKAGGVGTSGALYTLEMGQALKIQDLAEQMIRFYGLEPESDIPISYVGFRPGEKLEEQLHGKDEVPSPSGYPGIQKVERPGPRFDINSILGELSPICHPEPGFESSYRNRRLLREIINRHIPTVPIKEDEPEY